MESVECVHGSTQGPSTATALAGRPRDNYPAEVDRRRGRTPRASRLTDDAGFKRSSTPLPPAWKGLFRRRPCRGRNGSSRGRRSMGHGSPLPGGGVPRERLPRRNAPVFVAQFVAPSGNWSLAVHPRGAPSKAVCHVTQELIGAARPFHRMGGFLLALDDGITCEPSDALACVGTTHRRALDEAIITRRKPSVRPRPDVLPRSWP